jgi:hypothetical protein
LSETLYSRCVVHIDGNTREATSTESLGNVAKARIVNLMIIEGELTGQKRPEFTGKPYTFDLDQDFFHVILHQREVAYSDYLPHTAFPNEYLIVDFDREGRVVGLGVEGLLAQWAGKSLKNRARAFWFKTAASSAQSVSFVSSVVAELSKRAFFETFPKFDANGRLPAYAP